VAGLEYGFAQGGFDRALVIIFTVRRYGTRQLTYQPPSI